MGIYLNIHLTPNSSKNRIKGWRGDILDIATSSPPLDGKANKMLVEFLSDLLRVPKSQVSITKGLKGRNKQLFIEGIDRTQLMSKLKGVLK